MFERFKEQARQVIVLAQEEARRFQHESIGTEHLLLGLLREHDGVAAHALENVGVTHERVRAAIVRSKGFGDKTLSRIPFTPHAQKALELSLREALGLGQNYVNTEHLLLGLLREDDSLASRILLGCEVDDDIIRNEVTRILSGGIALHEAGANPVRLVAVAPVDATGDAELPELGGLSDEELDALIEDLVAREREISYRRRIMHGKIDILRAERDNRRGGPPDAGL